MYAGELERIGRRLFAEHLIGGNFGNISIRHGTGFFIKRSGAYLDCAGEPLFVPLEGNPPGGVSTEYRVHREIYKKTAFQAVVHAHPRAAVAASLVMDHIVPEDSEGLLLCPVIPVVSGEPGTQELADAIAKGIFTSKLVVARGHGTFAAGATLDETLVLTSLAEHSCRVLALKRAFLR